MAKDKKGKGDDKKAKLVSRFAAAKLARLADRRTLPLLE